MLDDHDVPPMPWHFQSIGKAVLRPSEAVVVRARETLPCKKTSPKEDPMNVPAAKHARDAASWAVPSDIHVARIREALRSLIDLTDLSRREIERRLVAHGVGLDLDRLLSGKFSLKVDQLLDVCRVLELHPVELFRLVFVAPDRRCPLLDRLHAVFDAGPPPIAASPATSAPAGPDNGELRSRVDRLQRAVEQMQRMPGRAVASR